MYFFLLRFAFRSTWRLHLVTDCKVSCPISFYAIHTLTINCNKLENGNIKRESLEDNLYNSWHNLSDWYFLWPCWCAYRHCLYGNSLKINFNIVPITENTSGTSIVLNLRAYVRIFPIFRLKQVEFVAGVTWVNEMMKLIEKKVLFYFFGYWESFSSETFKVLFIIWN